jgi:hypothetical protein
MKANTSSQGQIAHKTPTPYTTNDKTTPQYNKNTFITYNSTHKTNIYNSKTTTLPMNQETLQNTQRRKGKKKTLARYLKKK